MLAMAGGAHLGQILPILLGDLWRRRHRTGRVMVDDLRRQEILLDQHKDTAQWAKVGLFLFVVDRKQALQVCGDGPDVFVADYVVVVGRQDGHGIAILVDTVPDSPNEEHIGVFAPYSTPSRGEVGRRKDPEKWVVLEYVACEIISVALHTQPHALD